MEPRRGSWLEQRTLVVLEELELLGLTAPKSEVAEMIKKTLAEVASFAGISETSARRYVDDERLRGLAQEVAMKLSDERPGATLYDQPRTIPVPPQSLGRIVLALAEATRVRVLNADEAGAEQALELVSFLGIVLHEAPDAASGQLLFPQAALARAARLLEASAAVLDSGGVVPLGLPIGANQTLASAFLADAMSLRSLLGEHGADAGPTPDS